MISIIICSRTPKIPNSLLQNIQETIGTDFELIVIDNSKTQYSIFEAYNLGIKKSKGKFICFLHDDIIFKTNNWGEVLKEIFESNKKIGLIGIAGSKIKTKMPSAWWDCPDKDLVMNIIQHFSIEKKEYWFKGFEKKSLEDVVAIDGVFMAGRKVDTISFNEELKGFHNYDLNLSFEYLKNDYKLVVTKDILLEHFSIGTLNQSWYKSTLQIHQLYVNLLPLDLSNSDSVKYQEFKNGSKFLIKMMKYKIRIPAFSLWMKLVWMKPLSKFHLKFLKSIFK